MPILINGKKLTEGTYPNTFKKEKSVMFKGFGIGYEIKRNLRRFIKNKSNASVVGWKSFSEVIDSETHYNQGILRIFLKSLKCGKWGRIEDDKLARNLIIYCFYHGLRTAIVRAKSGIRQQLINKLLDSYEDFDIVLDKARKPAKTCSTLKKVCGIECSSSGRGKKDSLKPEDLDIFPFILRCLFRCKFLVINRLALLLRMDGREYSDVGMLLLDLCNRILDRGVFFMVISSPPIIINHMGELYRVKCKDIDYKELRERCAMCLREEIFGNVISEKKYYQITKRYQANSKYEYINNKEVQRDVEKFGPETDDESEGEGLERTRTGSDTLGLGLEMEMDDDTDIVAGIGDGEDSQISMFRISQIQAEKHLQEKEEEIEESTVPVPHASQAKYPTDDDDDDAVSVDGAMQEKTDNSSVFDYPRTPTRETEPINSQEPGQDASYPVDLDTDSDETTLSPSQEFHETPSPEDVGPKSPPRITQNARYNQTPHVPPPPIHSEEVEDNKPRGSLVFPRYNDAVLPPEISQSYSYNDSDEDEKSNDVSIDNLYDQHGEGYTYASSPSMSQSVIPLKYGGSRRGRKGKKEVNVIPPKEIKRPVIEIEDDEEEEDDMETTTPKIGNFRNEMTKREWDFYLVKDREGGMKALDIVSDYAEGKYYNSQSPATNPRIQGTGGLSGLDLLNKVKEGVQSGNDFHDDDFENEWEKEKEKAIQHPNLPPANPNERPITIRGSSEDEMEEGNQFYRGEGRDRKKKKKKKKPRKQKRKRRISSFSSSSDDEDMDIKQKRKRRKKGK